MDISGKEWNVTSENSKDFANKCSSFLYESYILNEKWLPEEENPINLEIKNTLLVDDYTYKCNWLALEKNKKIIGVLRYYCDIEESGFEFERFNDLPKIITTKRKITAEINRISIFEKYKNSPALIILLANLYYVFDKMNIIYSFGSAEKGSTANLYEKLGLINITNTSKKNKKYLNEKNIELQNTEFKCIKYSNKENNMYDLLWSENIIHRKKLFLLYGKIRKRYKITLNI